MFPPLDSFIAASLYQRYGGSLVEGKLDRVGKGTGLLGGTHPAKLWTDMNPDFFKDTVVEQAVEKI